MGNAFSKNGKVTQAIEHIPILGYGVSVGQAIAGNVSQARRAAARCTNETLKTVIIAGAAVVAPFTGPGAVVVWAVGGAAGEMAGEGIQAAIEESYTDEDIKEVGQEVQDEFDKEGSDLTETIFTHIGIGAAESIAGGAGGRLIQGYFVKTAETVVAEEGVELAEVVATEGVDSAGVEGVAAAEGAGAEGAADIVDIEGGNLVRPTGPKDGVYDELADLHNVRPTGPKDGVYDELHPPAGVEQYGRSGVPKMVVGQRKHVVSFVAPRRNPIAAFQNDGAVTQEIITSNKGFLAKIKALDKTLASIVSTKTVVDGGIFSAKTQTKVHEHLNANEESNDNLNNATNGGEVSGSPENVVQNPSIEENGAARLRPVVAHVVGGISKNSMPAVLGHMHIAITEREYADKRDQFSSYAYVTHSPTEKALLYIEDSIDGNGVHIKVQDSTKLERYLDIPDDISSFKDRRNEHSVYVHAHESTKATWAFEIYEKNFVVLKLVQTGTNSGSSMIGGYLCAHFNLKSDQRGDGGCYLSVINQENPVGTAFAFRFFHPDKYWWLDLVGVYKYGGGGARILPSADHEGLNWIGVPINELRPERWKLVPQAGRTFLALPQYPGFDGDEQFRVTQNGGGLIGPFGDVYQKVALSGLEGTLFGGQDGTITIESGDGDNWDRVIVSFRDRTGGDEYILEHIEVGGLEHIEVGGFYSQLLGFNSQRAYKVLYSGNMITGIEYEGKTYERYSLEDLIGRYVCQDSVKTMEKDRNVSIYVNIAATARNGKDEVWWLANNGEAWRLEHYEREQLSFRGDPSGGGPGNMIIKRSVDGNVTSLVREDGVDYQKI